MYLYNLLCMTVRVYMHAQRPVDNLVLWRVLCDRNVNRQTFNFMSVCAASSRFPLQVYMGNAWENRTDETPLRVQTCCATTSLG